MTAAGRGEEGSGADEAVRLEEGEGDGGWRFEGGHVVNDGDDAWWVEKVGWLAGRDRLRGVGDAHDDVATKRRDVTLATQRARAAVSGQTKKANKTTKKAGKVERLTRKTSAAAADSELQEEAMSDSTEVMFDEGMSIDLLLQAAAAVDAVSPDEVSGGCESAV